eukprot:scaffold57579_cov14-Prasinocladus_malaysianus.AAC.1
MMRNGRKEENKDKKTKGPTKNYVSLACVKMAGGVCSPLSMAAISASIPASSSSVPSEQSSAS